MNAVNTDRLSFQISGTRSGAVVEDIVRHAGGEIEAWLSTAQAACDMAGERNRTVLRALSATRGASIRSDLRRVHNLREALANLDLRRITLRADRQRLSFQQKQAGNREFRRLVTQSETLCSQLLEIERRRAETIGECARVALAAAAAAKTLYAQVCVLAGLQPSATGPGLAICNLEATGND